MPSEIKEKYLEQSASTSQSFILLALDLLRDTDLHFKASKNKRLSVEISLMKLSSIEATLKSTQAS